MRRADTSAASINEWTGERMSRDADVSDDVRPASVGPLGNYAVSAYVMAPPVGKAQMPRPCSDGQLPCLVALQRQPCHFNAGGKSCAPF